MANFDFITNMLIGLSEHQLYELRIAVEGRFRYMSSIKNTEEIALLKRPIYDLELTVRSEKCLILEGIFYIGELVQCEEKDLREVPGLGRKSIYDIMNMLNIKNLHLGMKIDKWRPEILEKNNIILGLEKEFTSRIYILGKFEETLKGKLLKKLKRIDSENVKD